MSNRTAFTLDDLWALDRVGAPSLSPNGRQAVASVTTASMQANVVGPASDACSMDDFYYLARTALVKDEKHFDKFDRAFAAYFKGVEMLTDFTKEVPLEWLRSTPSSWAPRRSMARRLAWLKKWVRNSTAMQSSASKA